MVSCRSAIIFLVASLSSSLVLVLGDSGYTDGPIPKYEYTSGSPNGPDKWDKLCKDCGVCTKGKKQSPINIVTKEAVVTRNLKSLTHNYAPAEATIINNCHDIVISFKSKVGDVTVDGKVYKFDKIHWHAPSEHTINNKTFPLEMHLVHKNDDGDLMVIGILYELGAADPFYDQFKTKLAKLERDKCKLEKEEKKEEKVEQEVAAGKVDLRSLQKSTGNYFRYSGSLTTPPCKESVLWNVLSKVRTISKEQVTLLTAALPTKDNRPTQPLNGRKVQFYNPAEEEDDEDGDAPSPAPGPGGEENEEEDEDGAPSPAPDNAPSSEDE